jgi:hypothetical protein
MRRALAILKHIPAVLCGLLVVAWVVSGKWSFGVNFPDASGREICSSAGGGSVGVGYIQQQTNKWFWSEKYRSPRHPDPPFNGSLVLNDNGSVRFAFLTCPIPFALTVAIPLAAASLSRFRFPLWSYFAWTALLAAELAYYLR